MKPRVVRPRTDAQPLGKLSQRADRRIVHSITKLGRCREGPRPAVRRARNVMDVAGSVALVTGANRGLGKCLCSALLARGATKVYAGARDVSSVRMDGVEAIPLDITPADDIAA